MWVCGTFNNPSKRSTSVKPPHKTTYQSTQSCATIYPGGTMKKLEKQITIGITEDQTCGISISPELTSAEAFQLVGTLALHVLNAYYKVAETTLNQNHNSGSTPKSSKLNTKQELNAALTGVKESMYDAMDSVFSNVLAQFLPDHPQYTLEDEAIIELTNKKIEDKYNSLTPAEQKKYSEAYQRTLAALDAKRKQAQTNENSEDTNS